VARKNMVLPSLDVSEADVMIRGTAPLVLLPLGVFKGEKLVDSHDKVDESLKLYRRHDGKTGFPAGAFKQAVYEAVSSFDEETKDAVYSGFHVIGEDETNMVILSGKNHGEGFIFDFKKPKRTVLITLPVLNEWSSVLRIQYLKDSISLGKIKRFLGEAGRGIGVGHRRPEKGTFEISKVLSIAS
jgi:hypothetical protein